MEYILGVVAFIAVKRNSVRVPEKNLRVLGNSPLYTHILSSLVDSQRFDSVYVYASDNVFNQHGLDGVTFEQREPQLDGDQVRGMQIFRSFVEKVPSEHYLLAHSTSPFISVETINRVVDAGLSGEYESVFTGRLEQTYAYFKNEPLNFEPSDFKRTQDLEPVILESNGLYFFSREQLLEKGKRVGDSAHIVPVLGAEAIDIDTERDWELAESYIMGRSRR